MCTHTLTHARTHTHTCTHTTHTHTHTHSRKPHMHDWVGHVYRMWQKPQDTVTHKDKTKALQRHKHLKAVDMVSQAHTHATNIFT